MVNPIAGVIVVPFSFKPKDPVVNPDPQRYGPLPRGPTLTRFSDFMFLTWQEACRRTDQSVRNLKWVIIADVSNASCVLVYETILRSSGLQLENWPGLIMDAEGIIAQAMIGCPNGFGVAWLLANHEAELGSKTIDQAVLFLGDNGGVCFAFRIADQNPEVPEG